MRIGHSTGRFPRVSAHRTPPRHPETGRLSHLIRFLVLLTRNEKPRTAEQSPARCLVERIQDNAVRSRLCQTVIATTDPRLCKKAPTLTVSTSDVFI